MDLKLGEPEGMLLMASQSCLILPWPSGFLLWSARCGDKTRAAKKEGENGKLLRRKIVANVGVHRWLL